jgi:2-dehydro-3-deoxyphosphooctonate aldolase (KDO 8-P synthase)
MTLRVADRAATIARKHHIPFVFKSSYKKANRTSGKGFTGIGMDDALSILREVKEDLGIPILTDIHTESEASTAAEVADVLQIPAFLSRQTDLLIAAARTGRVVNIKKGQFLAPGDMRFAAEKVSAEKNRNILLTERGASFGYHNLVVDMRSLVIMKKLGYPVILDATHAVQLPGAGPAMSGGEPEFIFPIARAGVAVGIDGLFVETHPDPRRALSDAASQLPLNRLGELLQQIVSIDKLVKGRLEIT